MKHRIGKDGISEFRITKKGEELIKEPKRTD